MPPKYPEFTIEQIDLVNYSRSFLAKALNSPFYQLFKQSVNPHILVEQVGKYADEFSKSLVAQRPNAFPDELKKKMKIEKDEEILGIIITDEKSSADEEEKENEKVSEEENQDEFAVKGLWEDGVESESLDSEEII